MDCPYCGCKFDDFWNQKVQELYGEDWEGKINNITKELMVNLNGKI